MSYGGTNEAWIVGAVRTPIGRHGGALSAVRPDDLGATVLEALMERTGVPPSEVEDVYFGCANQAGEDNRNVARMSLLLAGFPEDSRGRHRQPAVRFGAGGRGPGRPRRDARGGRRLRRRRAWSP